MRRLTSERLILEPVSSLNATTLWRVMAGSRLREYQDVPRYTHEEFQRRVAGRPKRFDPRVGGRYEWLIAIAESNTAIGWTSLRVGEPAHGAAELGYSIVASQRRQGFATEAVRAVVDFAFEFTALKRVDACCVPANIPSRRLLQRFGFREVAVQRNGAIVRRRPVDVVQYEMLRERWGACRVCDPTPFAGAHP